MRTTFAIFALVFAAGCDTDRAESSTPAEVSDRSEAVSFEEALAIATEKVPNGTPVEVEHMRRGDRNILEVELLVDGAIREVYIDPESGEVISIQDEDGSEVSQQPLVAEGKALVDAAGVSLLDASDIAREHVDGTKTIEVEYLVADAQLKLDVLVETADGFVTVHLDPSDGSVLGVDAGGSPEHNEASTDLEAE